VQLVTSSCHWNRLNVSNHTDGRIKNAGAKLREQGRVKKTAQSPQPLRESY
jgi:hypothetical protein